MLLFHIIIFLCHSERSEESHSSSIQKGEEPLERGQSPLSYSFPLPFKNYEGKGVRGIGLH
jgi:hypothetical protein